MVSSQKKKSYERGVAGEGMAANYLRLKGYRILEQRYKTRYGEIDLIALKGDVLAFVEVKARASVEEALLAVSEKSRRRIEAAAAYYISEHEDYAEYAMRFDVMAVPMSRQGKNAPNLFGVFDVHHLDNAWFAGE